MRSFWFLDLILKKKCVYVIYRTLRELFVYFYFIQLLVERRYSFELSKWNDPVPKKKILFLLLLFIRGFLCDSIDHLWVAVIIWSGSLFHLLYLVCKTRIHSSYLMFAVINMNCVHSHKWFCSWFLFLFYKSFIWLRHGIQTKPCKL